MGTPGFLPRATAAQHPGERGISRGEQWPVPGVPACRPGSVTHSPRGGSHAAAFPRDRGDVSERQRLNGEPGPCPQGQGRACSVPPLPRRAGKVRLGGRTPAPGVPNRAACFGTKSSKAWSCPASAKVGKALWRWQLAGWDVAASEGNAQL